jgi:hypothetical protein
LRAVADDVLPFSPVTGEVLPWFPQLKWAASEQAGRSLPHRLPLGAVYSLAGGAHCRAVETHRLSSRQAAETLFRHTVAARLFAPRLLARHFDQLSSIAEELPAFTLRYPWSPTAFNALEETVCRQLAAAADPSSTASLISRSRPSEAPFLRWQPRQRSS